MIFFITEAQNKGLDIYIGTSNGTTVVQMVTLKQSITEFQEFDFPTLHNVVNVRITITSVYSLTYNGFLAVHFYYC